MKTALPIVGLLSASVALVGCNDKEQTGSSEQVKATQVQATAEQRLVTETKPQREIDRLIEKLFTLPEITTMPGVSAELVISPGDLYDPLWMDIRDDGRIWLSDDGLEVGEKGSLVVSFNKDGSGIVWEMGPDQITPGIDNTIAPEGWGKYGGKIILISQPGAGFNQAQEQHSVKAVTPRSDAEPEVICVLPNNELGKASLGMELRFGPEGSEFDGLWVTMSGNKTVYRIEPDGTCEEFVSAPDGWPLGMGFSPDGSRMLLGLKVADQNWTPDGGPVSKIISITRDGVIEDKPVVSKIGMPPSFAHAPEEWGDYAGQLFFIDSGVYQKPPMTQLVPSDGKVYRLDENGEKQLVAEGFRNPAGSLFDGKHLYISDVNGDFMTGRELPDGMVWKLTFEQ